MDTKNFCLNEEFDLFDEIKEEPVQSSDSDSDTSSVFDSDTYDDFSDSDTDASNENITKMDSNFYKPLISPLCPTKYYADFFKYKNNSGDCFYMPLNYGSIPHFMKTEELIIYLLTPLEQRTTFRGDMLNNIVITDVVITQLETLFINELFCRKVLELHPLAIRYFYHLNNNREIMFSLIQKRPSTFYFASLELKSDADFIEKIIDYFKCDDIPDLLYYAEYWAKNPYIYHSNDSQSSFLLSKNSKLSYPQKTDQNADTIMFSDSRIENNDVSHYVETTYLNRSCDFRDVCYDVFEDMWGDRYRIPLILTCVIDWDNANLELNTIIRIIKNNNYSIKYIPAEYRDNEIIMYEVVKPHPCLFFYASHRLRQKFKTGEIFIDYQQRKKCYHKIQTKIIDITFIFY